MMRVCWWPVVRLELPLTAETDVGYAEFSVAVIGCSVVGTGDYS